MDMVPFLIKIWVKMEVFIEIFYPGNFIDNGPHVPTFLLPVRHLRIYWILLSDGTSMKLEFEDPTLVSCYVLEFCWNHQTGEDIIIRIF